MSAKKCINRLPRSALQSGALDVTALTRAHSGVYIADLPGNAAGDCRTKRVTTGTAEIETH
jgi:hypothetical protein